MSTVRSISNAGGAEESAKQAEGSLEQPSKEEYVSGPTPKQRDLKHDDGRSHLPVESVRFGTQDMIKVPPLNDEPSSDLKRLRPQEAAADRETSRIDETVDASVISPDSPNEVACDVCTKIMSVFRAVADGGWTSVELGSIEHVLGSTRCSHSAALKDALYRGKPPAQRERAINMRPGTSGYEAMCEGKYFTLIARDIGFHNGKPLHPGRARAIDPEWIDTDVIKEWYSRCVMEHGDQCDAHIVAGLPSYMPLRLIDVIEGCVVSSGPAVQRYVSLSYLWGKTECFRTLRDNLKDVTQPGALFSADIGKRLHQTVRDAIGLVRAIGERYIWVDALCMVQDDGPDFQRELEKMHMVYASSFLCIIAEVACLDDPESLYHGLRGIRGVSRPRSLQQTRYKLAGGEQLAELSPSHDPFGTARRDWADRGWTFQEYLFAKRRLIYNTRPRSLDWECRCSSWSELTYTPERDGPRPRALIPRGKMTGRGWDESCLMARVPYLWILDGLIRAFNGRELTKAEDVLFAFSGLQTFLTDLYPGGLLFGIPEFWFDIALAWCETCPLQRRVSHSRKVPDSLGDRLPSWSWMGWKGTVEFPHEGEFASMYRRPDDQEKPPPFRHGFSEPVTEWFVLESLGSRPGRKVLSRWHEFRTAAQVSGDSLSEGWTRFPSSRTGHPDETQPYFWYRHDSMPEESSRYPVPVLCRGATNLPTTIDRQGQYLCCRTSRAFLYATGPLYSFGKVSYHMSAHKLYCALEDKSAGGTVGGIRTHCGEYDEDGLTLNREVELIAHAKGWIQGGYTRQGKFLNEGQDAFKVISAPAAQASQDNSDAAPGMAEPKRSCYFVLWVKRKNGIMYRYGSGFVLAGFWDKCKEDDVEVIIG